MTWFVVCAGRVGSSIFSKLSLSRQILWCKGLGDDVRTNKYFMFRRSYAQLYHHMKPGKVGAGRSRLGWQRRGSHLLAPADVLGVCDLGEEARKWVNRAWDVR